MPSDVQYLNKIKKRNIELYNYFMRGMEIVELLNSKMYEAYIVGGAVRDYLLGIDFKDIDIATNATPKEVLELFPNANGRFSELGCVELKEEEMIFQITTFRDENLVTTRKTKNVHYSKKLTDDVLRRDFTINSLALSSNYNVIDILKGKKDLRRGIIRVIGKGKNRFREDPLRILRGFELISRYNFSLSHGTSRAISKIRKYVKDISEMKFSEMLYKIMSGKHARYALAQMANLDVFCFDAVYRKWLLAICHKYKKTTIIEKLALLYYMYGSIPKNVSYNKTMLMEMDKLIKMATIIEEQPIDEMIIYKYGGKLVMSANQMLSTLGGKYKNQAKLIKKIDKKLPIHDRRDFNFSAEELIHMMNGEKSARITEILEILISKVVRGEILNNNTIIRQEALRLINIDHTIREEIVLDQKPQINSVEQVQQVKPLENKTDDSVTQVAPQPVINIENIKNEYAEEFKTLYVNYMRSISNYMQMSDEEKENASYKMKMRVRSELLSRNPKYQILVERGII